MMMMMMMMFVWCSLVRVWFISAGVVVIVGLFILTTITTKKKKEQEPLQGQIHRQARTGVTRSMYMHVCVCMDMYTPKLQLVYVCATARRCRTS